MELQSLYPCVASLRVCFTIMLDAETFAVMSHEWDADSTMNGLANQLRATEVHSRLLTNGLLPVAGWKPKHSPVELPTRRSKEDRHNLTLPLSNERSE